MKRMIALMTVTLSLAAMPAWAISLDDARSQGLVGERADGYIGAVTSAPSAEVVSLVDSVNRQRKVEYQKVAAQNGQTVAIVEKLAGDKLRARLGGGQFYMDASGSWKRK